MNIQKRVKKFNKQFLFFKNHPNYEDIKTLYINNILKSTSSVNKAFKKIKLTKKGEIYKTSKLTQEKIIKESRRFDKQYNKKIYKLFTNYKKPINILTSVKHIINNDGKEMTIYEKQYVDIYKIIFPDFVYPQLREYNDISLFTSKITNLLGNLYKKYKNGVYQIDLLGKWFSVDDEAKKTLLGEIKDLEDNILLEEDNFIKDDLKESLKKYENKYHELYIDPKLNKISIRSFELLNYKKFFDEVNRAINPPDSKSYLLVKEVDVKFIKPIVGGCYSCKGHGKDLKIDNLTLHNPYSTNNNCFFKIIEEYLDFKITKNKCNEIRKLFNIKPNAMISINTAYKIAKKYINKKICFITNKLKMLYGDDEAEIKIFCLNDHYMTLKGETKKCNECNQFYINNHTCNKKVLAFINKKKRLIHPIKCEKVELLNKKILHYDIETQYNNLNNQHIPYIVGFCYYDIDEKLVYNEFYGDNCMKEFYNFLGFASIKHIKFINAYNGSGFDHYYLFRLKIEEDDTKIGKFILNNGNLLSGDIKGKTLIDLCRHLSGSLSSNLKSNGCSIAKGELNHNLSKRWEETDEERKKEVSDYLRCDVLGLCELYEKVNEPMFNKYNINLCSKLTTSSNAFDIWRDKFLKNDIFLLNSERDIDVRKAIYGARCYKNKNRFISTQYDKIISKEIKYDDIDDYIFDADVVSLYPTAMSQYKYPVGRERLTTIYEKDKLGIYLIDYEAPKNLLNPILPRKEDKKLIWDLNNGSGWYSSVDIESAESKGYIIKILVGYCWDESEYIFKDYIDEFYKMKQEAIKGTPSYSLAKLYLNGLYGKMLQRPNHSKDAVLKNNSDFWSILNKNIIQEMSNVGNSWLVKYIPKEEFLKPSGAEKPTQLGVFILAYSRKIMSDHYDKCGNTIERLPFYYDTDSLNIHSSCLDKIKIDKNLGGIDDDVGGKVIKAIYIAPKMYAFQYINKDNELKYHFRGKGVSNNVLTWIDFEIMDKGLEKDFYREFQIKKINMKKSIKEDKLDFFCHKHIYKEDTKKTINKNLWKGRCFIDNNNSVPFGYDLSLIK